ncbi:MAG: hypothetical protein Q4C71_01310 [Microbacteriaceae bacterium]|nr:hypothetical protein [Microbacteriaceae bacterium]
MRRTNRALAITLVLLAVFTAVLLTLAAFNGPKLKTVTYNAARLTTLKAQRVSVALNQRIQEINADSVKITPAADFKLQTRGAQIVFTFEKPLQASTGYTLELTAKSAATGAASQISATITTDPMPVTALIPHGSSADPSEADRIVQSSVGGKTQPQTVLRAPAISEFTTAGQWAAAITKPAGKRDLLLLVQKFDGTEPAYIPQPPSKEPRQLQFSSDGSLLGVRFFDGVNDELMLYSLAGIKSGIGNAVMDKDGKILHVKDWYFEQGSSVAHILTVAGATYRVPYGGRAEPSTKPWPATSATTLPQNLPLTGGGSVEINGRELALKHPGKPAQTLYTPAAASSTLTGLCLAPNKQYVAAQVQPAGGEVPQLAIINLKTGLPALSTPGMRPDWCQIRR